MNFQCNGRKSIKKMTQGQGRRQSSEVHRRALHNVTEKVGACGTEMRLAPFFVRGEASGCILYNSSCLSLGEMEIGRTFGRTRGNITVVGSGSILQSQENINIEGEQK
jgi:hypothetical protein